MRIGVFGGTFDPVHTGHLIIAEQCREQAGLDAVWFIPSAHPPHKVGADIAPYDRRAEMLALAIAGHPAFAVDHIERDRPGPSYTADTLDELHRRHPDAEWNLMLGSDGLPDLPKWRQPERIVARAAILAVARPGHEVWPAERLAAALALPPGVELRMRVIPVPLIDIASRDLRRRVAEGRSIRYFVPRAVEAYIADKGLYLQSPR